MLTQRIRIAVCGAGHRGRTVWVPRVLESQGFELVGVHDVSSQSLSRLREGSRLAAELLHDDLRFMLERTRPEALIVCPVISAHAEAVELALGAGCHVLVEKPLATPLQEAVRLERLARESGRVLAVVQNWRTKTVGSALHQAIRSGLIGEVSHILFRYVRDRERPHLPEYLFEEEYPLLNAIAVHHLDLFRYVLGTEFRTVAGHAFRPRWSRYRSPSGLQLWLEAENGCVVSYVATFSSRNGHLPQESLLVEGESGSLVNESVYSEPPLWLSRRGEAEMIDLTAQVDVRDSEGQYVLGDREILRNFREAMVEGVRPVSSAADHLRTLATVEAARVACESGQVTRPPQLLLEAGLHGNAGASPADVPPPTRA